MISVLKVLPLCLALCSCSASVGKEAASKVIEEWFSVLPFPDSEAVSQDLADLLLFSEKNLAEANGAYAHTKPPDIYKTQEDMDQFIKDVEGLLRRGANKFKKQVTEQLATLKPSSLQYFSLKVRHVLNSYNDFYNQVKNAISLGPRQLLHLPEHAEYGPETNFWLKFRPYLSCSHIPRLGPEFGGLKRWCNFQWFHKNKPKYVLSGGSGGDFSFEDSFLALFPDSKVVTLDCFMSSSTAYNDPNVKRDPKRLIYIEECLHGPRNEDLKIFGSLASKVTTFPALLKKLKEERGIPHFDLHKFNIEAFEYPMYGHIMRDADKYMANTKMVHIEMHRHGMADHGLNWNSLLLSELLFATFYSGGFHAVAQEKWHDSSGATDFVFVNQSWFLESEVDAYETAFDAPFPMDRGNVDGVTRQFDWNTFFSKKIGETTDLDHDLAMATGGATKNSGMEVSITIKNEFNFDTDIYWVHPTTTEEVHVGSILANSNEVHGTFQGHVFHWREAGGDETVTQNVPVYILPGQTEYSLTKMHPEL